MACVACVWQVFVSRLLETLACVQYIHEQTVEWTHMRELSMQMQHGVYASKRAPTDLKLLLRRVFGDTPKSAHTTIEFPPRGVLLVDGGILRLQLEEARSNALKHRQPGSQIRVHSSVEQTSAYDTPWLHTYVDSQNRDGLAALSPSECVSVFAIPAKRGEIVGDRSPGEGIGLDNVMAAAHAIGGKAWLSTYSHPDDGSVHTVFHVSQPCEMPTEAQVKASRHASRLAARQPEQLARHTADPAAPKEDDSLSSTSNSTRSDSNNTTTTDQMRRLSLRQSTPLCLGLDDSEMLQQLLQSVFTKLGASPDSRALGTTVEEQESFIPLALGNADLPPADIVVLDVNLNLPGAHPPSTPHGWPVHHHPPTTPCSTTPCFTPPMLHHPMAALHSLSTARPTIHCHPRICIPACRHPPPQGHRGRPRPP